MSWNIQLLNVKPLAFGNIPPRDVIIPSFTCTDEGELEAEEALRGKEWPES